MRRSDNDQYGHLNNSVYNHLLDSIVNTYLIQACGRDPMTSSQIGLVVSSYWQAGHNPPFKRVLHSSMFLLSWHIQYFAPLSFPDSITLGLRVTKLGTSSATYEVGVFREDADSPVAVGGYTHVFVDSASRKSQPMVREVRDGLQKLLSASSISRRHSKL